MSKKTKKQKILAELHRKLALVSQQSKTKVETQTEFTKRQVELVKRQNHFIPKASSDPKTHDFAYVKEAVIKPKITTISPNYAYVKHDLIKITIFTLLALISQGVLYFLLYRK